MTCHGHIARERSIASANFPYNPDDPAFQAQCDKWANNNRKRIAEYEMALVEAQDRIEALEYELTDLRQIAQSYDDRNVEAWEAYCSLSVAAE